MKVFVKALLTLIMVVLLAGATAYFANENFLIVDKIQLSEAPGANQPILYDRIEKDLNEQLSVFSAQPIWKIPLDDVMSQMKEDNRIERASVRRSFPNKVLVEITPRQPLMLLLGKKGELFPIASDASILPALSMNSAPDLPILRGLKFFENEKERQTLVKVLEQLPQEGLFSQKSLSEIELNRHSEIVMHLSDSGMRVLIGKDLDQGQVSRVEQVLRYLESRSIKGRVIDARFSKKVVVRVRNAS
ncbi:MAG: FtsQ-type POTRA domain-containing protein [Bdellovibrionales bacterium]|nr:FtsQ-type POTRA domain-containing protein [Bdellovibrionales bacterium]